MKTSTWRHQWVIGLYTTPEQADRMIALARGEGVPSRNLAVIGPDGVRKRRFGGLRPEPHHGEGCWMRRGGLLGMIMGMLVGALLFREHLLSIPVVGVGGAIIGTLFGLLASGADTSLTVLYDESGAEGKIMVAINCHPHQPEETQLAERLIRQSGVQPLDFPRQSPLH